jgi:acyl-CoA synthetase (AMP-forming)/AMP-acid ligase II/short-subunit dehydrogenase
VTAKPNELLPRPVRIALGATGLGIADAKLREAVAGKVVLVTGASSGIGEATARRLGANGATVLMVARSADKLETIAAEINSGHADAAHPHACDLADTVQVERLVNDVLIEYGQVDVVVNNAGLSIRRWVSQSYDRFHDYERTINVNYLGPVRLLLGLLPSMRERGSGHIVNIATVGVDLPPPRWTAYIASKTAFEKWLGGVAPEILADGVTVSSIHMQLVRSPMLGPFRMYRYMPGMSTEEAAGMVCRAIVLRPRIVSPMWARIAGPVTTIAQARVETALARQVRASQEGGGPGPMSRFTKLTTDALNVATEAAGSVTTIAASGTVRAHRPDRLARAIRAQRRFGAGPAFGLAAAAELYPERNAVIDERGDITFGEIDVRIRKLARALSREHGLSHVHRTAVMCRNHRGYHEAVAAVGRLGCDLVPLNTDFAGPQLKDVLARENIVAAIYDGEFDPIFEAAEFTGVRLIGDGDASTSQPTTDALIAAADGNEAPSPPSAGRIIMLTSGTTGTPKGAHRSISPRGAASLAVGGFLELSRFKPTPRSGEPIIVAPPLFHLYGMIGLMLGAGLGSPVVVRRRFEAEAVLKDVERTRAGTLLAVPTMLKRIMDLPAETRAKYDTGSLRAAVSGAAPLAPELALAFMDEFGEILFNGYASTEVGAGTLATPRDIREAPGTVGKAAGGVSLRILNENGKPVPTGTTGRIFVGSPMLFDGYSGGGGKEVIDGRMSTGDVGHLDHKDRLFIDGRDDDMILSGGENVFPQEVEELIAGHAAVADAAVYGIPDSDFGQRLAAMVVLKEGASATDDELREYVKARLARYKVPREIEFADALPRTNTGKLQRRKLTERHVAR